MREFIIRAWDPESEYYTAQLLDDDVLLSIPYADLAVPPESLVGTSIICDDVIITAQIVRLNDELNMRQPTQADLDSEGCILIYSGRGFWKQVRADLNNYSAPVWLHTPLWDDEHNRGEEK